MRRVAWSITRCLVRLGLSESDVRVIDTQAVTVPAHVNPGFNVHIIAPQVRLKRQENRKKKGLPLDALFVCLASSAHFSRIYNTSSCIWSSSLKLGGRI